MLFLYYVGDNTKIADNVSSLLTLVFHTQYFRVILIMFEYKWKYIPSDKIRREWRSGRFCEIYQFSTSNEFRVLNSEFRILISCMREIQCKRGNIKYTMFHRREFDLLCNLNMRQSLEILGKLLVTMAHIPY